MYCSGYCKGIEIDHSRPDWVGKGGRPIAWSAWYPVVEEADKGAAGTGIEGFFDLGAVRADADLAPVASFPVVVLSHGTGGTAESLGWFAAAITAHGFVVIAANHHGNSGLEPIRPKGFLCWWDRATDLPILLTRLSDAGPFAGRIDSHRVSALGFSLGAHTVLALAGAMTSLDIFMAWVTEQKITAGGPKEFPDLVDHIPELLATSEPFKQSWERHGDNFTDQRVKAVVAIAPPPPVRGFEAKSVGRISVPVTLITGGADIEAPTEQCTAWLMAQNVHFKHHDLGEHVGHYTFLGIKKDKSVIGKSELFTDHPAVDRGAVHNRVVEIALAALAS